MYQSGRAGDAAKKRKSPSKSGRVGITAIVICLSLASGPPGKHIPATFSYSPAS